MQVVQLKLIDLSAVMHAVWFTLQQLSPCV